MKWDNVDTRSGFGKDHTDFNVEDERPVHPVVITTPFYIGATEVTVGQFRQFVEAMDYQTSAERNSLGIVGWDPTPPQDHDSYKWAFRQKPEFTWRDPGFEQAEDAPVVGVSWEDASAFCAWMSEREDVRYRLPTEAEWEYVCRAGTSTYFSFGDEYRGEIHRHANIGNVELEHAAPRRVTRQWLIDVENDPADSHVFSAPAGSYDPNPWGLFDLHGNVWEWCADRYLDTWYAQFNRDGYQQSRRRAIDPLCEERWNEHGAWRVIRGGSWFTSPIQTRSACRGFFEERDAACYVGFRVAREAPEEDVSAAQRRFADSEAAREELKQIAGGFREERDGRLSIRLREEQFSDDFFRWLRELDEPVDLRIDAQNRLTAETMSALAAVADLRGLIIQNIGSELTDEDCAALAGHPELEVLQLTGTANLTDNIFGHLIHLTRLESLQLEGEGITDVGLERLPTLQNLRELRLDRSQSSGAVLERCVGAPLEMLAVRNLTDGNAHRLAQFPRMHTLIIHGSPISASGLGVIAALPQLRTLEMSQCRYIDDDGFAVLSQASHLERLNVSETQAGDRAVEALIDLNHLNDLNIGSESLSDQGMRQLCRAISLEHLTITPEATSLTDAGLEDLWRLQRLRSFQTHAPHVSGAGLSVLSELPQLSSVAFVGDDVTDAALQFAARSESLERISIGNWGPGGPVGISDAGLISLIQAPKLARVSLFRRNTQVSDEAIAQLRADRPGLQIDVRE